MIRRVVFAAVVYLTSSVMLSGAPVAALTNGDRQVEKPYTGAAELETQQLKVYAGGCTTVERQDVGGAACFKPQKGERFVAVQVEDGSEEPVGFRVAQGRRDFGAFCEKTDTPLPLKGTKIVLISIKAGGCGPTSIPTQGIVRAVFSS